MTLTTGQWKWPVVNIFTPNLNTYWPEHFLISVAVYEDHHDETFLEISQFDRVLIPNNLVSELVSQWLRSQLYYVTSELRPCPSTGASVWPENFRLTPRYR